MARITVEDCLEKVNNRFALIHLAAKRVRQIRKGSPPLIESKNKDIVVSLREIASGGIYPVLGDDAAGMIQAPAEAHSGIEGPAEDTKLDSLESPSEGPVEDTQSDSPESPSEGEPDQSEADSTESPESEQNEL